MSDEDQTEDQYMTTGAPNFESALSIASGYYRTLNEEAQEEMTLMVVGRFGEITIIGSGDVLPSNEDGPQAGGFIVYKDDIVDFLEDAGDDDGDDEEEEDDEDEGTDDDSPDDEEPSEDIV